VFRVDASAQPAPLTPQLAATGFDAWPAASLGGALVLAGLAALLGGRRRRLARR